MREGGRPSRADGSVLVCHPAPPVLNFVRFLFLLSFSSERFSPFFFIRKKEEKLTMLFGSCIEKNLNDAIFASPRSRSRFPPFPFSAPAAGHRESVVVIGHF